MGLFLIGVLAVFVILLFFLLSNQTKGSVGESRVNSKLTALPSNDYHVLKDVLLETSRGTSQIDHLVVSRSGVFVIETKNYKGWIHGSDQSEYWTQTIYKSRTKFRNPVKQNWYHVYALKELLSDIGRIDYFPIVVFAGSAELKNIHSAVPVIYSRQVHQEIAKVRSKNPLSEYQVLHIVDRLTTATLHGGKHKREHNRNIQDVRNVRKLKEQIGICPRCGRDLVIRDGKYGKFYGCTGYPQCRYTRNIRD